MEKEPITIQGLEKLKQELKFLKEEKRPEIINAIAEARSHGDLKENAEYHAAKEQQSHSEGRIQEIEDLIARANVIDVTNINNDGKVIFGSTVYLQNLDTNTKLLFADINSKNNLKIENLKDPKTLCILIGPEGDFSLSERESISSVSDVIPFTISKNVLRSDTAVISAISLVNFINNYP